MSAIAPAFIREQYEIKDSANIHDIAFRALAEYNTIAHVHKKMEFFWNFEAFLDHYVKLRARLRVSSSSIRAFRAERGATLARESQSLAGDDEMDWRASSLENSDEVDSVYEAEEWKKMKFIYCSSFVMYIFQYIKKFICWICVFIIVFIWSSKCKKPIQFFFYSFEDTHMDRVSSYDNNIH